MSQERPHQNTVRGAFRTLQGCFTLVPLATGADNPLDTVGTRHPITDRHEYLAPWIPGLSGLEARPPLDDGLAYRIRGDTVRTLYATRDGFRLLDQTDPRASDVRRAILGGYLAEGVELREKLVDSVLGGE